MKTTILTRWISCCAVICLQALALGTTDKQLPLPGEVFDINGNEAFLILPENPKANTPWVWYAPTLKNLPEANEVWMFERFLSQGIAIAGIDVGESFGSPNGRKVYSEFYQHVTSKRNLSAKPCLLARSRGGLMLYNWAVENPKLVSGIAGVYPVCNIASYPGVDKAAEAFGLNTNQLKAELTKHNPIDRLKPLAEAGVPLHHIHGDKDTIVPLDTNSGMLAERYRALGGSIELEVVKDGGHDGWSGWFQSTALTNFVIKTCLGLNPEKDAAGFVSLFNGKDLAGWDGNPKNWSVKDGVIVGVTGKPDLLKGNEFLIWRGGMLKNFELRLTAKMTGNNSGIQYRSRENAGRRWSVSGYQCDVHPSENFSAMLYEEGGRGIVAKNGQQISIDPSGKKIVTKQSPAASGNVGEWREYTIIGNGNHLVHKLDGKVTMELFDYEEAKRSLEGLLAFQLHAGPAMTMEIKDVKLKHLPDGNVAKFDPNKLPKAAAPVAAEKPPKAAPNVMEGAQWIWHKKPAMSKKSRLRTSFDVIDPKKIANANLYITCDNGAKIYINQKLVGSNPDWQEPSLFNVHKHLREGANQLRVEASNTGGIGGMIATLTLEDEAGEITKVQSNKTWQGAPAESENWKPAQVISNYGANPWGRVFDKTKPKQSAKKSGGETIASDKVEVPEGFTVEKLYNVPKSEQGSWVALAIDKKDRMLACDQYGSIYRMSLPEVGKTEALKPEKIDINLGKAHGLLVAFDSLYVMVNEDGARNGLYRVTDSDGDDNYDKVEFLHRIPGGGEHGIHSIVVSPDGKRLFFNCGNSAQLPEKFDKSRAPKHWDEDHILPRLWDGRGFMRGKVKGAAGYIFSMNPDGSDLELWCHGFRNQFDITFDLAGQLFTYDADMEWDIGSPWYRQTRLNHCLSGAEYGWHTGAGKWPDYYPDNLPTTIDIGAGSPTGVVSGKGAKFPAKYQRAIFINDWTYGTMWAIHLTPDGSSYKAEKEDFLHGKPLPLTDVVIHPKDGAMYFAVGGRRSQSGVYRVTYTGNESTAPVEALPLTPEFAIREEIEAYHVKDANPATVLGKAWPLLGHSDRYIRNAARVAIERLPVNTWQERVFAETRPVAIIEACIALARSTGSVKHVENWPLASTSSPAIAPVLPENVALQNQLWTALNKIDYLSLDDAQKLAALRAMQLVYTRHGKPETDKCAELATKFEALYPSKNANINRELVQLLVAVDSKKVVSQTLGLLTSATDDYREVASEAVLSRNDQYARSAKEAAGSRPNSQQLLYLIALRNAKVGWNPENRKTYFSWVRRAKAWKGGNSFSKNIENIRTEALANIAPPEERAALDKLSAKAEVVARKIVPPKGPGKAYTLEEAISLTENNLTGRNFENGKNMYHATICGTCHRFNGEGGSIGPDLTGSANRYTIPDLMENIINPSAVISDQYGTHKITKKDGSLIIGRIVSEQDGKVLMITNPFAPNDQLTIPESEIAKKEEGEVSIMPPSLINSLNEDELRDLVAYLLSGGDSKNEMFAK